MVEGSPAAFYPFAHLLELSARLSGGGSAGYIEHRGSSAFLIMRYITILRSHLLAVEAIDFLKRFLSLRGVEKLEAPQIPGRLGASRSAVSGQQDRQGREENADIFMNWMHRLPPSKSSRYRARVARPPGGAPPSARASVMLAWTDRALSESRGTSGNIRSQ